MKEAKPGSFEVLTDVMPALLDVILFLSTEASHRIDRIIITTRRYCLFRLLTFQLVVIIFQGVLRHHGQLNHKMHMLND